MLIEINFKSGLPVYLQVVDQIKAAAASGALRPGEPLPSIRPLAEQLRVNRNTVAKAYAALEAEGVIETLAGKGCFLKEGSSPFTRRTRLERLAREIDAAIVQAHHSLVSDGEFLDLVKERLESFAEKRTREARAQQEER
ncbi:MAG TPA: GntR family transcriptional regulator [Myxococcales bacterium]|nr:GntR family transcriptional regulator [Myxococcales bacterium]